jgi:Holliday junction resolvasome RuvABC endonuclease subunit
MTKLIFPISKVENRFQIALKRNASSLGLDTASKTGYCIAKTDNKKLILSIGFVDIDVSKIKDKEEKHRLLYSAVFDSFSSLINSKFDSIVIENVYHGVNPDTTILLARIGAIAYAICKMKEAKNILWLSASQARKALDINQKCPKGKSKETIVKRVNKKLDTTIQNNDEIDAIVLAINGLLK